MNAAARYTCTALTLLLLLAAACDDDDDGEGEPTNNTAANNDAPNNDTGDLDLSALNSQTFDALLAAATDPPPSEADLEAAVEATADPCDALAAQFAPDALALADESRDATLTVDCDAAPDWLDQVTGAIEGHDGQSWLTIELSGTCVVPEGHDDEVAIRIEEVSRVELRGAAGAVVDASTWSAARTSSETIIVDVYDSSDVVVRGLDLIGATTATEGDDAGGVRFTGGGPYLVEDIYVGEVTVDYDAIGDPAEGNAFAIKVVGEPGRGISQVAVRFNAVGGARTGQSETITVAGDVTDFVVASNVVYDVDNIGIDLIGGESYEGAQARRGLVCGNALGGFVDDNPAYEGGDAAAAGVYLDGGGSDTLVAYNLAHGFDRGYEIGAEDSNPAVERAHLYGNLALSPVGSGLLVGSLTERASDDLPTDRGTLVQRHLVAGAANTDTSSCASGAEGVDEAAARCEAGSAERRGVEVCAVEALADAGGCAWE